MSNISLKVTIEKKMTFSKLWFTKFVIRSVMGSSSSPRYHFKTPSCNLKIRDLGAKLTFLFNIEKNYDVLKSKNPCVLLTKNKN